ncbi:hypothetical protein P4571_08580 [Niallia alba]|uniref:hypothetical protein n=1 Tax=Niallia alba TaxID=2729105 RepID=UPI002E20E6A3|nr:hypothetical protein [Niallia alba]
MKANISEELESAIHDKIIIDLTINYLENRIVKSQKEKKINYAKHLEYIRKLIINERINISKFLKDNGVKIYDPIPDDDGIFVQYDYSVKVNGGYKEGYNRYWRAALKNHIRAKLDPYFVKSKDDLK